jgi:uncharacterized protein YbaA (DUF1428 family)
MVALRRKLKEVLMPYVDGFVLPLPKRNTAKYHAMARRAGKIWMKHGALSYHEAIEDDVPVGKVTSFPQSVKRKKGEAVVFAYATYKSRKHRDQVMKKVMNDPYFKNFDMKQNPFDGKRMFWGGFKTLVSL